LGVGGLLGTLELLHGLLHLAKGLLLGLAGLAGLTLAELLVGLGQLAGGVLHLAEHAGRGVLHGLAEGLHGALSRLLGLRLLGRSRLLALRQLLGGVHQVFLGLGELPGVLRLTGLRALLTRLGLGLGLLALLA